MNWTQSKHQLCTPPHINRMRKCAFRFMATGILMGTTLLKPHGALANPLEWLPAFNQASPSCLPAKTIASHQAQKRRPQGKQESWPTYLKKINVANSITPEVFPESLRSSAHICKTLLSSTFMIPINALLTGFKIMGKGIEWIHQAISSQVRQYLSEPFEAYVNWSQAHPYLSTPLNTTILASACYFGAPYLAPLLSQVKTYKASRDLGTLMSLSPQDILAGAAGDFFSNALQITAITHTTRITNYLFWNKTDQTLYESDQKKPESLRVGYTKPAFPDFKKSMTTGFTSALVGGLLKPFKLPASWGSKTEIPMYGKLIGDSLGTTYRNFRRISMYTSLIFDAVEKGNFRNLANKETYQLVESFFENGSLRMAMSNMPALEASGPFTYLIKMILRQ